MIPGNWSAGKLNYADCGNANSNQSLSEKEHPQLIFLFVAIVNKISSRLCVFVHCTHACSHSCGSQRNIFIAFLSTPFPFLSPFPFRSSFPLFHFPFPFLSLPFLEGLSMNLEPADLARLVGCSANSRDPLVSTFPALRCCHTCLSVCLSVLCLGYKMSSRPAWELSMTLLKEKNQCCQTYMVSEYLHLKIHGKDENWRKSLGLEV